MVKTPGIYLTGAVLGCALLAGCSGAMEGDSPAPSGSESAEASVDADGITRPTPQELADGMESVMASAGSGGTFTAEEMLCIATGLEDSDLSNRLLRAMAEGDEDVTATGEEQTRVNDVLTTVMIDCAA